MNFKMTVTIRNPEGDQTKTYELDCSFAYDENQYGNGYFVGIKGKDFYPKSYDIRYDKDFRSNKKEVWLAEWAYRYWTGENGAWSITKLTIEKVA